MGKHDRAPTDPVTGAVLETPELVAATLAELRTKMAAEITAGRVQRFVRDDDQFLLAFLRNRKHDVDAALSVVISFSKFWYSHPEVIEGLCAARCRDFQACRITQFLNGKDRNGNAVMALYMGAMKPGLFTPKQQMEFSVYTLAHLFEDEEQQLHGVTYVESMKGFSLSTSFALARSMDSKEQKELMELPTNTFPMRIRGIYVTDQPWYFTFFWNIVKPCQLKCKDRYLIPGKMASRLRMFGTNYAKLHEFVPPEVLPPEFGGFNQISFDAFLDSMERREKSTGMIGGFAVPFSVEDPTGARRRVAPSPSDAPTKFNI